MNYVQLIVLICAALAALIPLGVKLYKTSEELIREKNWPKLVAALSKYMEEAEHLFEEGAQKKEWVLTMIRATAENINYELTEQDMQNLSELIDILCDMTKVVNVEGESNHGESSKDSATDANLMKQEQIQSHKN